MARGWNRWTVTVSGDGSVRMADGTGLTPYMGLEIETPYGRCTLRPKRVGDGRGGCCDARPSEVGWKAMTWHMRERCES